MASLWENICISRTKHFVTTSIFFNYYDESLIIHL